MSGSHGRPAYRATAVSLAYAVAVLHRPRPRVSGRQAVDVLRAGGRVVRTDDRIHAEHEQCPPPSSMFLVVALSLIHAEHPSTNE